MGKIQVAFIDEDTGEGQSTSHEIETDELALLFQLADKLTDNDLMKLERACKEMEPRK